VVLPVTPAAGVPTTVEAVLDGVRAYEAVLAARLPADWVAENGPCYRDYRTDGAVWLNQVWEDYNRLVRASKDPSEYRPGLIAIAVIAVKLAADISLTEKRARRAAPAHDRPTDTVAATMAALQTRPIPGVDDTAVDVSDDD
jgi:hypothetical protein